MGYRRKTGVQSAGWILDRLLIDGRRTLVACVLVLVMAGMWIRVLIGHKAAPAAAAGSEQKRAEPAGSGPSLRIAPVELPRLPGRHDAIYRDFFSLRGSPCFQALVAVSDTSTDQEVRVASSDDVHEVIQRVAQTLRLEAVYWSEREEPKAFISNRLLSRGDFFTVESNAGSFAFDVLEISGNSVRVGCRGVQVTLKLLNLEVRE